MVGEETEWMKPADWGKMLPEGGLTGASEKRNLREKMFKECVIQYARHFKKFMENKSKRQVHFCSKCIVTTQEEFSKMYITCVL